MLNGLVSFPFPKLNHEPSNVYLFCSLDLWFLFLKQQINFIAFLYHKNKNISLILEQEIKKKQYETCKKFNMNNTVQNLKYDVKTEKQIYN